MSDLISRKAALDCFRDWFDKYGDVHTPDEMLEYRAIELLPSAQPEIIRCKDCKYNDLEEQNSTTRWLPCIDAAWPDDWFCGCAERRKDG